MTLHAYFTDIYLKKPQTYETFFLDWQPLKDFVYLTKKKSHQCKSQHSNQA